jgi:tRNA pseudouridine55 synthase
VTVYELELLEWNRPRATIRCRVSAGTYVRALARDLGVALGTVGTLESLLRTKVGHFRVEDALPTGRLDAASLTEGLVPIEEALADMPSLAVSPAQAKMLLQGKAVQWTRFEPLSIARTEDHSFLAVVRHQDNALRTERIIYAD